MNKLSVHFRKKKAKAEVGNAKIKAVLCVFGIIGLAMLAIPFFLEPPGRLAVRLADDVFNTDLTGKKARLKIISAGLEIVSPIQKDDKGYVALFERIKNGPDAFEVTVENFNSDPVTADIEIPPLHYANLQVSLIPTFGRLKIVAINAKNKQPLGHYNANIAALGQHETGGAQGVILSELPPGKYVIELKASGYCSKEKKVTAVAAETREVPIPISPEVTGNELARVMLDWGPDPKDLDSHLLLPKNSSLKSRHVYYPPSNKIAKLKNGQTAAELDIDHTRSEGTETTTIYRYVKGTYKFAVRLYAGEGSIGASEAIVELITNGCEKQQFHAPVGCQNKWWYVFDMKYDGTSLQLITKNNCVTERQMGWRFGKKK